MKIGILTYHASCNFGANLQAYSTYSAVKNSGNDPIVIDWYPKDIEAHYKASIPLRQIEAHHGFVREKFVLTKRCENSEDIAKELERLGISNVIIGSDAVFNTSPVLKRLVLSKKRIIRYASPNLMRRFPNAFWGLFADYMEHKPVMQVMSASSQNTPYGCFMPHTKKAMAQRLLKFKYLSVRDDWTKSMVCDLTHGALNPPVTPDPVFAFEHNVKDIPARDYIEEKFGLRQAPYVLMGFRRNNTPRPAWIKKFCEMAKSRGMRPLWLPMPDLLAGVDYELPNGITPLEWYALIKYSKAYIGNNMHPIVIALHNCVPFYSFDQYGVKSYLFKSNEKASKTYHILKSADMFDWRTKAIFAEMQIPSPEHVWDKLDNFDKAKCAAFAATRLAEYKDMMTRIFANFGA